MKSIGKNKPQVDSQLGNDEARNLREVGAAIGHVVDEIMELDCLAIDASGREHRGSKGVDG